MKILRISLRNIASLGGEHTVDFTRTPLLNTGLYSISGPTGSGKSTLLDALCLALYSQTPRLAVVSGTEKIVDGERGIEQSDPRNLLRRGSAEGFAEVCFVGVDQQTYTARWRVWRARNQAQGALQSAQSTLYRGNVCYPNESDCIASGKITEFKSAIEDKIRLSFDQFRRAILLAQGDFATFLKAKDSERALILEALTGTEHFAVISKAVFQRHKLEQAEVEKTEVQLQGTRPMAAEERSAAESALQEAEAELRGIEEKRTQREAHETWFLEAHKLSVQEREAQTRHAVALERNEAAQTRRREIHLTELARHEAGALWFTEKECGQTVHKCRMESTQKQEHSDRARLALDALHASVQEAELACAAAALDRQKAEPLINRARALDAKLPPLQSALVKAEREWEVAHKKRLETQGALRRETAVCTGALAEKRNLADRLECVQFVEPFAKDLTAWMDRLDEEAGKCREHAQRRSDLAKSVAEEERLQKQMAQTARRMESAGSIQEKAVAALRTAREAHEKTDAASLAAERIGREAARDALEQLRVQMERLRNCEGRLEEVEAGIGELNGLVQADQQRLVVLETSLIPEALSAEKTAGRMLEIAEQTVSDHAKAFRAKLRSGEACPVCGSAEHPFVRGDAIQEDILRNLTRDHESKKSALSDLQTEARSLKGSVQKNAALIQSKTKLREKLRTDLEDVRRFVPQSPEALGIWSIETAAARGLALAERLEVLAREKADWEKRDHARIEAEKAFLQADTAAKKAAKSLDETAREHAGIQSALNAAVMNRTHGEAALEKVREAWTGAIERIRPLRDAVRFEEINPEEDPEGYREELKRSVGLFEDLRMQIAAVEERFLVAERKTREFALELPAVEEVAEQRTLEKACAQEEYEKLRNERAELFGGGSVDEAVRVLEDSVLQKQTVLAGVRTRQQQAATQCELARQAFESAASALRLGEEKHALAVRAIQEWLVGFEERAGREVTVEEIGSWLERDHTSVERERADLQRIEAEIHTARGVWNACREACERHELGRPTAESLEVVREALEALKGSGNTAKKKVDERRSILWSDDQRKLQAGELLKALEEKRRRTEPWARLNAFIGSADGKAFRELAQQWTLDVLVKHANAQLEQLAARYYLKRLDKCLNLMVVDRQMSDQVRSVHSLSGGESFLVSLGLALGLASLTSNRMRIESLFIDEGFGSLDADTLRTAMGALAHLESQGRKVGIISHVAEMADAIPVQIRVVKGPGGASRIVVPDGRV